MKTHGECPICHKNYVLNQKFKKHVTECKPFKDFTNMDFAESAAKRTLLNDIVFENYCVENVPDLDFEPEIANEPIMQASIKGKYFIITIFICFFDFGVFSTLKSGVKQLLLVRLGVDSAT